MEYPLRDMVCYARSLDSTWFPYAWTSSRAIADVRRRGFLDVSDFTTGVNFNTVKANGVSFVYIKATEGTGE